MTADRFELLLSQRLILRDLGAFIDGRIRRIHGKRVAELLHELLDRRIENVMQFEKAKAQLLGGSDRESFSPVRLLGRLRYRAD